MDDGAGIKMKPVSVASIVTMSQTLASLVEGLFGPCGEQTLLSTSSGKVVVSRDGMVILSSLQLAHPVAYLIMESLCSYYSRHHNGSKTFILYLSSIMKAIANSLEVRVNMEQQKLTRINVATALINFLCNDFNSIAKLQVERVHQCQAPCTVEALIMKMKTVLRTSLYTCVQKQLVDFFTNLLCDFLSLQNSSMDDVVNSLNNIVQDFEMCHTKVATQPQQRSFVCQGLLVEADLEPAFRCQLNTEKTTVVCAKDFILTDIDFENCRSEDRSVLFKPSAGNLSQFFTYKRQRLKQFLVRLKAAGVNVIFHVGSVPQFVVGMCQEERIFLFCLPQERIKFLSCVICVPVLKEINVEHICEDVKFSARAANYICVGNKRCTVICTEKTSTVSVMNRKHMVVCAPTDGMCDQLCKALFKALKELHFCLKPSEIMQNVKASAVPHDHLASTLQSTGQCCTNTLFVENVQDLQLLCGVTPISHSSECWKLLTVPSGGGFEACLYVSISDYFCEQYSDGRTASKLIQEMLVAVPQTLHANLCSDSKKVRRLFTSKWLDMLAATREGQVCGLSLNGDTSRSTETSGQNTGLESMASKLSLVSHVLQLVVQLLRIEAIIPVSKLPDRSNDGGSEDRDSD